jgi:exonuclease III
MGEAVTAKRARQISTGYFSCFNSRGPLDVSEIKKSIVKFVTADRRYGANIIKFDLVNENGKKGAPRLDIYTTFDGSTNTIQRRNEVFLCKCRTALGSLGSVRMGVRSRNGVRVKRSPCDSSVVGAFDNLFVWTWNVNGTVKKKSLIETAFTKWEPDIVGLQETRRGAVHWPLQLNNYSILSSDANPEIAGARGVALAIHPNLQACGLGKPSPFWVFGKVFGGKLESQLIVGSVYIPTKSTKVKGARRSVLDVLPSQFKEILNLAGDAPVIILMDANCSRAKLQLLLEMWGLDLSLLPVEENKGTFNRPGRSSTDIDHILINKKYRTFANNCRVLDQIAGSDHFVLQTTIAGLDKIRSEPIVKRKFPKLNLSVVKANLSTFRSHNRWDSLTCFSQEEMCEFEEKPCKSACGATEKAPLPPRATHSEVDCLNDFFVHSVHEIAAEVGAHRTVKARKSFRYRPSGRIARLIARRIKLESLLRAELSSAEFQELTDELKCVRDEGYSLMKIERNALWNKRVAYHCSHIRGSNARAHWAFVRKIANWRNKSLKNGVTPIKDPVTGQLLTDPQAILQVWEKHYRDLAADENGRSKDVDHWSALEGQPKRLSELTKLNIPPIWTEICITIEEYMKSDRDGGEEQIPMEIYKLLTTKIEGVYPSTPMCAMGRNFFNLVLQVWNSEELPLDWGRSAVVSIPKKGDLTDKDNYRGISLMSIAAKIVYTLMQLRLTSALCMEDDSGTCRIVKYQCGFRPKEECVAQATCLFEVLQRRKNTGQITWSAFIDMQKAFDTVPHEALMLKVEAIGVRGKFLRLIRKIYDTSTFVVRTECGTSEPVSLQRGVRQGCPLSPILFNIFINDLLAGMEGHAVSVPSLRETVPGLLFADDLCLLANSESKIQSLLDMATIWADRWGMAFGHKKCNVVIFDTCGREQDLESKTLTKFFLQRGEIKIANHYTYLGLVFHCSLDLSLMTNYNLERGEKTLGALRFFLRSPVLPIATRVMVLKACLIPVLTYGGELWGMNSTLSVKLDKVLNDAVRLVLRMTGKGVSLDAIKLELHIESVHSICARLRNRAIKSWGECKTLIADLISDPHKGRSATWVSGSIRWLNKHGPAKPVCDDDSFVSPNSKRTADISQQGSAIRREFVAKSLRLRRSARSYKYYVEHFGDEASSWGRKWNWITRFVPRFMTGFTQLARARSGSLITASYLRNIKKFPLLERCPCCNEKVFETPSHYILTCTRWSADRNLTINRRATLTGKDGVLVTNPSLLEEAVDALAHHDFLDETDVLSLILGGRVGETNLDKSWYISHKKTIDASELSESDVQNINEISEIDGSDPAFCALINSRFEKSGLGQVALFLHRTFQAHENILQRVGRVGFDPASTVEDWSDGPSSEDNCSATQNLTDDQFSDNEEVSSRRLSFDSGSSDDFESD